MKLEPHSVREALLEIASDGKGRDLDSVSTRLAKKFNIPTQGRIYDQFKQRVSNAKAALIIKGELSKLPKHVRLSNTSKNRRFLDLCEAILCSKKQMIKSEIEEVSVWKIKGGLPKNRPERILIQFAISDKALEKVLNEEKLKALQTLINLTEPYP